MGVEENMKARLAAEEIASLADEEAEKHGKRFWIELARIVGAHVPVRADGRRGDVLRPMTDQEARSFGQQETMPYGQFAGEQVDRVPLGRLQWYANQTFTDELRRYLDSPRIRRELGE